MTAMTHDARPDREDPRDAGPRRRPVDRPPVDRHDGPRPPAAAPAPAPTRPRPDDEVGTGPLARASAAVWWFLVVSALVVLTGGLPLGLLVVLAWDPGNAPLIAAAFVPLGPALAAAVFAWRRFLADRDLQPARHFWRGYRLDALDVLRWWVPTLAVLALLVLGIGVVDATGMPGAYAVVLLLLAVALLLWAANALVLSATLSLRTRDVARLAAYYLAARPRVTLGSLSHLVISGGVVLLTSDWVLVALAGTLAFAVTVNAEPVLRDAAERFTRDGAGATPS